MARKRQLSLSQSNQPLSKRQAKEVIVVDDDADDEPLEAILAKIREQEESEALARQLQSEWMDNGEPSSNSGRIGDPKPIVVDDEDEPIVIDDEDEHMMDSDEALARRLAAEWAAEDRAAESQASSSRQSSFPSLGVASSSRSSLVIPELEGSGGAAPAVRLRAYEDLFIGTRQCTKCKTNIASPRGYVRVLYHASLYVMT